MDAYLEMYQRRAQADQREHDSEIAYRAYLRRLATLKAQGVDLPPELDALARRGQELESRS